MCLSKRSGHSAAAVHLSLQNATTGPSISAHSLVEALILFCGCHTALGRMYGLQVSQTGEGTLQGVAKAIVRGRQIRCVTF